MASTQKLCVICGVRCPEEEWLNHLVEKTHLRRSQMNFLGWGEAEKGRSAFLFSSFSLVDAELGGGGSAAGKLVEVLEAISAEGFEVTDFVVWERKECLGIVQLETKQMAGTMIKRFGGTLFNIQPAQIKLDKDFTLHIRKLDMFSELELRQILPEEARAMTPPTGLPTRNSVLSTGRQVEASIQIQSEEEAGQSAEEMKQRSLIPNDMEYIKNVSIARNSGVTSAHQDASVEGRGLSAWKEEEAKMKEKQAGGLIQVESGGVTGRQCESQLINVNVQRSSVGSSSEVFVSAGVNTSEVKGHHDDFKFLVPAPPRDSGIRKVPSFSQQRATLSAEFLENEIWIANATVRILDEEYTPAAFMLQSLRKLLQAANPAIRVTFLGDWFLQLKSGLERKDPLVFVSTNGNDDERELSSFVTRAILSHLEVTHPLKYLFSAGPSIPNSVGESISFAPGTVHFQLVTDKTFAVEAQLNKMIEYLGQFDDRLYPALMLMRYWAFVNPERFSDQQMRPSTSSLPEHMSLGFPTCLDWMVIFYMTSNELLPTPRNIQARPHIPQVDPGTGIDIGFHWDCDFVAEWKSRLQSRGVKYDSLPISSLQLFLEILEFYGGQAGKALVLNTRDGEVLPKKVALGRTEDKLSRTWTKLTTEEVTSMQAIVQKISSSVTPRIPAFRRGPRRLDMETQEYYMLHPIIPHWIIGLPTEIGFTFRMMGYTAGRLEQFIQASLAGAEAKTAQVSTLSYALRVPFFYVC